MTFIERIESIIKPLSRAEFARKIGIHVSTIALWDDKHLPKGDILQRIHKEFNVNIDWLLTGEGVPYINKEANGFQISEPGAEYSTTPSGTRNKQIKISDALAMAARVLESQTSYATALYLNIQHFDRAIQAEQRIANLEARLKLVENQLTLFSEREGREQKLEEAIQEEKTVGVQE